MNHRTGDPRYIQVSINADITSLSAGDKEALPHLIRAVQLIGPVWTKQMNHQDFSADLRVVAGALEAAAELTTHEDFRKFLYGRALAFRTNSYHASDTEWVQCLGAPFELIIGPFEPTEKLGGEKEFEGTLGIVLPDEQERVRQYEQLAVEFESALAKRYGFIPRYTATPITIIDEVVAAGGAMSFIAMASKLPNDEDIRSSVGSKTTLFRNIIKEKFTHLTFSLAQRILGVELDPEIFLQYIIGHELSHGMNFRFQRKDFGSLASSLEEAKADVFGVLFLYFLAESGIIARETAEEAAIICIADSLREIRLDVEEAHAVGALMRFNWLQSEDVLRFEGERIVLERSRLLESFGTLGDALYVLTQTHSPEGIKSFVGQWGAVPDQIRPIVRFLKDLPLDIVPIFQV